MQVDIYGQQVDLEPRCDNPLYLSIGAIVGVGLAGKVVGWVLARWKLNAKRSKKQQRTKAALERLEESVKKAKLSSSQIKAIVSLDLQTLTAKLKSGELKPTQVLKAYQAQALAAHKLTNCLVEPIEEAEAWAVELEKQGSREGALYGVPVSIKDNYGIKGYDSTVGCSNWIDEPCTDDAVIVKVLKAEGAIPFVKTNVPQTMISFETSNPIFGGTRNAQDQGRGAGGSSGGEGALIGCGGSPLGFGSDIGGSIRIPAAMNGICGFKPTAGRISGKGTFTLYKGQTNLQSVYGPMGRDVESMVSAMQVLCSPAMPALDTTIPSVPFDLQAYSEGRGRKLRVGVMVSDPYLPAVPAMQRAVLETQHMLTELGHEVEAWSMEGLGEEAARLFTISIIADGGKNLRHLLRNDKTDTAVLPLMSMLYLPKWIRRFLVMILWKKLSKTLAVTTKNFSANDWWGVVAATAELRERVMADWRQKGLDAIVCPAFTCLPMPFGQAAFASGATLYTMLFNVLNFPAGCLPVTRVTDADVRKTAAEYPARDPWEATVKKSMVGSEGLVVNVQVVALPWQEELCLHLMKQLQDKAQFKREWRAGKV